ncbi:MAG: hypothetical protein SGI84_09295 [Gemmatimonadota bacterium]|nr:hypothetical protein [Gemmatimonadota bacterium]
MLRVAAATLLLSLLGSPALSAQGGAPQLGRIDFPASGSPEAHREFVTGVLWMHSFEYSRAAAAFQRAQRLDPDFAMAYWGEAMTHTHPVWNEQDLDAARAILQRLAAGPETRRGKAATAREQLYLDAVEALYGAGGKEVRDTLYSQAMERLVRAHPEDLEAKAFYSLSLIGLSQGVRDTTTYRRASAWADTVFAANPEHPGAAHYLIHAWDDPGHAPLGLAAAHAYSGIAPDAAHAQHMTTHIFLAMGMWEEVVARNTVAMGLTARIPGHYTSWLHYGLLQQGRLAEATAFLEEMRENMESQRLQREGVLAWMRLAHVLSTDAWDSGPALWSIDVTGLPATGQAPELYFRGLSGYRLQDRNTLDSARTALAVLRAELARQEPDSPSLGELDVQLLELRAHAQLLAGRRTDAVAVLREAAALQERLPVEFGPPAVAQPSHELLGSLLEGTAPAAAVRAYQGALELAPMRSISLGGLARSAKAAGLGAVARQAMEDLEKNGVNADASWRARMRLGLGVRRPGF